jgi:hypothetical protein
MSTHPMSHIDVDLSPGQMLGILAVQIKTQGCFDER